MAPSATSTNGASTTPSKMDFTTFRNVINGKLVDSKQHAHGVNPATKEALHDVPIATKEDLDEAVTAARAAFEKWKKVSHDERVRLVLKFADLIEAHAAEFTKLLTTEQGKPTFQAELEVQGCSAWLRAQSTIKLEEEIIQDDENKKVVVRFTPLGVVGAIVPWNFPNLLNIGKVGPALLTGNVIITKPSPFTPYSALKLAELAQQVFPPGVVQALSGDDSLGPWMTTHPGIDKISFTGSTATGKKVAAAASATLKRVTLELGGKDPAIVTADVDIPAVAAETATFALLNSGQICTAIKRIYVHKSIFNAFRDAMVAHIQTLKTGDGFAPDTFCGPIQNEMQYGKVASLFDEIEKANYKVAVGGSMDKSAKGFFFEPTVIENPPDDSRIVLEEPFGPIVPLLSWDTEEEVVRRANDTDMGLGASVWGRDMVQVERIARQIESGTVWMNQHFDLTPLVPFGGYKQSGLGVEWGASGLKQYCNQQSLHFKKSKL